jgi:hypothetical protein
VSRTRGTRYTFTFCILISNYSGYTLSIARGCLLARIWPELRMDMRPTGARNVRKRADRSPKRGNLCDSGTSARNLPPPFRLECVAYPLPSLLWHYSAITTKWKICSLKIDRKKARIAATFSALLTGFGKLDDGTTATKRPCGDRNQRRGGGRQERAESSGGPNRALGFFHHAAKPPNFDDR